MSFENIQWHFYLGYCTGALILFRIFWGLVGPKPVRLSGLLPQPREVVSYIKTMPQRSPSGHSGHNPVGSLSVIAILVIVAVQVTTGLFVESDDFFESAPLSEYVSEATISTMTGLHHWISRFVLGIVAVHVAAVLFYLIWKKENLIKPMFTGVKWVKPKQEDSDQT